MWVKRGRVGGGWVRGSGRVAAVVSVIASRWGCCGGWVGILEGGVEIGWGSSAWGAIGWLIYEVGVGVSLIPRKVV